MEFVCPCCQAEVPLEPAIENAELRRAIGSALGLSKTGKAILPYVRLFTPVKRALAGSRAARLIKEVVEIAENGAIRRRGRDWDVPEEVLVEALEAVVRRRDEGKLVTPLKSHGYLHETAIGIAEKRAGEDEVRRDEERRGRPRPGAGPDEGPTRIDPEATLRGIEAGYAALGRKRPQRENDDG